MSTPRTVFKILVVMLLLWIFLIVILPAIDLPHAVPGISGSGSLHLSGAGIWFFAGCVLAVMLQVDLMGARPMNSSIPNRELFELVCSLLC
jgi:hypothetical protein